MRRLMFCIGAGLMGLAMPITGTAETPDAWAGMQSVVLLETSNLPILKIDTHGETIVDPVRIPADLTVYDNGPGQQNSVHDSISHFDGRIAIELRGSTGQNWPKKPYRFETQDSLGQDLNIELLGLPSENDWVLHNPFSDKTLMRNVIAYHLANEMGYYASRTRFCEVILNETYYGVYVLCEKIKRDKNRVNISRMDSTDVDGDALTGGYIIKIDKRAGEQIGGWSSENKVNYQYHYPKPSDILPEQEDYIQAFMARFEAALKEPDGSDLENGYQKYIDIDNFADYYILHEVTRNIDAYRISAYMHKDRDSIDGRLKMGPAWDFNLSLGNANYYDGYRADGWNIPLFLAGEGVPYWWVSLFNDPVFTKHVNDRWLMWRESVLDVDQLHQYIDALADTLDEAQERNYRTWPVLGEQIWPNAFVGNTYDEEVEFMKEWLEARILWMDDAMEGLMADVEQAPAGLVSQFSLEQNYPNPFNGSTFIRFHLNRPETVQLRIFNVNGQVVRTLLDEQKNSGCHQIVWDGRDHSGQTAASGIYTCQLRTEGHVMNKKMMYLR